MSNGFSLSISSSGFMAVFNSSSFLLKTSTIAFIYILFTSCSESIQSLSALKYLFMFGSSILSTISSNVFLRFERFSITFFNSDFISTLDHILLHLHTKLKSLFNQIFLLTIEQKKESYYANFSEKEDGARARSSLILDNLEFFHGS